MAAAAAVSAAGNVAFMPYAEARPAIEALGRGIPEARWTSWTASHDRDIRARLVAGDEDTIVNWLLLGTSFTRLPRAFVDVPPGRPQELARVIGARAHELVAALIGSTTDERRLFARDFFARRGLPLDTPEDQAKLEQHLLMAVVRVNTEQARFADELKAATQLGDQSAIFAARSKLFRERGLSLDTSIQPNFALDESLAELKKRGLLKPGTIRDVAVIGPGLDFSDKNSGYDFYPQQTLQPFALVDSLVRLGLADPAAPARVTTLDLSPRVNDHLSRARQLAAAGQAYRLRVPIDAGAAWTPRFLAYWNDLGARIGTGGPPAAQEGGKVNIRSISVRPDVVSRLDVQDLDVVVQRFTDRRFDLIVATNVLVYYDEFEQALAMSNIASMIRPGGFFLSNNALVELPSSPLRSAGYLTTQYSSRADDGDHVVWYRKD